MTDEPKVAKKRLPNVMIDLETMSTAKNAAIVSIGAVKFDFKEETITGEFYTNITLVSCARLGMHRMASTLNWWSLDANKEARDAMMKDAIALDVAIKAFSEWCSGDIIPWGNGASFDLVILENAIKQVNQPVPWKFYHESCYRTMKRMFRDVIVPRDGTKHHALEDARYQARHLMAIMKQIKLKESAWQE